MRFWCYRLDHAGSIGARKSVTAQNLDIEEPAFLAVNWISVLAVGVLASVGGLAVGGPQTEQIDIGSTHFCIPRDRVIVDPVWVPSVSKQLLHEGVAFTIAPDTLAANVHYQPALNIRGAAIPISGSLVPRRSDEWLGKLPTSNYWRQLAEGPKAIIEVDADAHQIRAFQNAARDRWIIWTIDPNYAVEPGSIEKGGSILALCHRTDFRDLGVRSVDETVSCQRRSVRDDLFLSYTFGGGNVRNVTAVDEEVWRIVLSWRCGA